jgi:hypothetical protein
MRATLIAAALILSGFPAASAFANEHMHVNHDHEHTRYQPPPAERGSADQATPTAATLESKDTAPSGK